MSSQQAFTIEQLEAAIAQLHGQQRFQGTECKTFSATLVKWLKGKDAISQAEARRKQVNAKIEPSFHGVSV